MGQIKRVQKKYLLKESWEATANIENLYNARKAAIVFFFFFFEEFTSRAFEGRLKYLLQHKAMNLNYQVDHI